MEPILRVDLRPRGRWIEEIEDGEALWRYISCRSGYAVGLVFPSFSYPGKYAWSYEDVRTNQWHFGAEEKLELAKDAVENLKEVAK